MSSLGIDIQFKTVDINGKKIKLEIRYANDIDNKLDIRRIFMLYYDAHM